MSKTTIQTRIEGDHYVATTPHAPELSAQGKSESVAINALSATIRRYHALHPNGSPWIADPDIGKDKDTITRSITGLWPAVIAPLTNSTPEPDEPATEQESDHGSD